MADGAPPSKGFHLLPGHSRPVVGVLSSSIVEPWARRQWEGIVDAAHELDVELVSFIGGVLRSARYDEGANVMYDLAELAHLDGLIIWSTAVGWLIPHGDLEEFISRFGGVPRVSMEMRFPGVSSVLMDDYGGMRAAVDHLIEVHGKRRIAFIRGPVTHQGMETRYRGYCDSLAAHRIPFEPLLVSPPSLSDTDDSIVIRALFNQCGLNLDAVAGADDVLALIALPILAELGVRVGEDVAVVGFDNMPECMTSSPPLSSVIPPFREMGHRAMKILMNLMAGDGSIEAEAPALPFGLALRSSCGCAQPYSAMDGKESVHSASMGSFSSPTSADFVEKGWGTIERSLLASDPSSDLTLLRSLWDRFAGEVSGGEKDSFLPALVKAMDEASVAGADPTRWLRILATIQRSYSPWTAALSYESRLIAGEITGRANEIIAEAIQRQIVLRQVDFTSRHQIIRKLTEMLGSLQDTKEQMDAVAKALVQLDIASCYLSLFVNPDNPCGEARLILAYDSQGRRDLGPQGLLFPAPELVPLSVSGDAGFSNGLTRLALALYIGVTRIGFVIFGIRDSDEAYLCEVLRWHLSGAIKGAADIRAEKKTAAEKTYLLKELQHRVKNSMALIASITRIEGRSAKNPEVKNALAALEARIAAVAHLYQELYDTGSIERIDLADYLGRVVDSAAASVGLAASQTVFDRSLEHCFLDMKRAVSLGLIINELATNSLKHAFPDGRSGRIRVGLANQGEILLLSVQDDGVGLPPGFNLEEAKGFGLHMVSLLATQVDGELRLDSSESGTTVELRLSAEEPACTPDFESS